MLHTLANSISCERAFSALNQLHTKTRNALTSERVDKLLYIQMNGRTLRRDALIENLSENENEDEEEENDLMVDEDKDATFVGPAHTEEALPGQDSLVEDSQDEFV